MKAKIKCRNCGRIVAETTEKFNPDVRPDGSMLRLVDPFESRGWAQVLCWNSSTMCSHIFCPQCEFPLAPSGRFNLVEIDRVGDAARERQEMIDAIKNSFSLLNTEIVSETVITTENPANGKRLTEEEEQFITTSKSMEKRITAQTEGACPKCGKVESAFKTKAGFVNHCRMCRG